MDLIIAEIKRQMKPKRVLLYVTMSIVIAVIWAIFIINGRSEGKYYKGMKGLAAINAVVDDRKDYAGKMTTERFDKSCKLYNKSLSEKNEVVMNNDLLKMLIYSDALSRQQYLIDNIFNRPFVTVEKLPDDCGRRFYETENLYYQKVIKDMAKNEREKALAIEMWDNVEKPYTYHCGYEVWSEGVEHLQVICVILIMFGVFFTSGIIVGDKQCGLDEVVASTRGGRKKLFVSKLIIPMFMGLVIYLSGVGTYISILKYYLPSKALLTSTQLFTVSLLSCNLGQIIRIIVFQGMLVMLMMCVFTVLLSSISKKTSTVISLGMLIIIGSFILAIIPHINNPFLKGISLILPANQMFFYTNNISFPIVSILGRTFSLVNVNMAVSLVIMLVSYSISATKYIRR